MNTAILATFAALGGSMVGAMGPVLSGFLVQRGANRQDLRVREITLRVTLYSDVITESAALFCTSLAKHIEIVDFDKIASLYALAGRIHLVGSDGVVLAVDELINQIMISFSAPNLSIEQLRALSLSGKPGPLETFSAACRQELKRSSESFKRYR